MPVSWKEASGHAANITAIPRKRLGLQGGSDEKTWLGGSDGKTIYRSVWVCVFPAQY